MQYLFKNKLRNKTVKAKLDTLETKSDEIVFCVQI